MIQPKKSRSTPSHFMAWGSLAFGTLIFLGAFLLGSVNSASPLVLNEISAPATVDEASDSEVYFAAGPGGTQVYATRCSWKTTYTTGTVIPSIFELYHQNCQDAQGNDLTGPAANPPACASGWTSTAINWRPTGISQWGPEPISQHGDAFCANVCTDEDIFEYPQGAGAGIQPSVINITGIGERICTK